VTSRPVFMKTRKNCLVWFFWFTENWPVLNLKFTKIIKICKKNYIIDDEFYFKIAKEVFFTVKKSKFLYEYNIAFY
jgi:hypothetical protein